MHLFAPEVGMMGTSGIVGPCILQATGAGYSFKLLKKDLVGVAFFGDGAVNNGAFHEGINLATIWDLPVIFVCENNQYATEVPFTYSSGNPDVGSRGSAYGLPGVIVDGNDVLRRPRGRGRGGGAGAGGRWPHADRVQDLSHPRPFRGDARRRVSHARGSGRLESARPHRPASGMAAGATAARTRRA